MARFTQGQLQAVLRYVKYRQLGEIPTRGFVGGRYHETYMCFDSISQDALDGLCEYINKPEHQIVFDGERVYNSMGEIYFSKKE